MGLWDDEERPIEPSQRASPESRKAPPRRISFPFFLSPSFLPAVATASQKTRGPSRTLFLARKMCPRSGACGKKAS